MSESEEIIFMQARLLRLASNNWKMTIQNAGSIFSKYDILPLIRDCYYMFHTEGDEAVFEEIEKVLKHKGVDVHAEIE
ncbi:MAG: DUF3791 domain-containing protein [Oribacterium sp.]|nr:DUF3791 domain-containing protein [Oribacterium sp.]